MNDVTFSGSRADVFRFISYVCQVLADKCEVVKTTGDEAVVEFRCVIKKKGEKE